jgi:hypothetical protein
MEQKLYLNKVVKLKLKNKDKMCIYSMIISYDAFEYIQKQHLISFC